MNSNSDEDFEKFSEKMETLTSFAESSAGGKPREQKIRPIADVETNITTNVEDEFENVFEGIEKRRKEMSDELKRILQIETGRRNEEKTNSIGPDMNIKELLDEIEQKYGASIEKRFACKPTWVDGKAISTK